jgi:hypothetical protein
MLMRRNALNTGKEDYSWFVKAGMALGFIIAAALAGLPVLAGVLWMLAGLVTVGIWLKRDRFDFALLLAFNVGSGFSAVMRNDMNWTAAVGLIIGVLHLVMMFIDWRSSRSPGVAADGTR